MYHQINEQEFIRRAAPVIADKSLLPVTIEIAQAWFLIGGLQVAWRHPDLPEFMKTQLESIARQFAASITELHPDAGELIEMGWRENEAVEAAATGEPGINWLDFRFEHDGQMWTVMGPDNALGEDAPYWWALPLYEGDLAAMPTQTPTSFGSSLLMKHLHIYEVGMVSDRRTVRAPSAGAAAIFYSLHLIETNNLFMAVVYTEDGQPFTGEKFWINPVPDEKHVVMVAERVKHHLQWCSVWEGE